MTDWKPARVLRSCLYRVAKCSTFWYNHYTNFNLYTIFAMLWHIGTAPPYDQVAGDCYTNIAKNGPCNLHVNTYHAGHWFYWAKLRLLSQNSNISQVISGITKPKLGMFVLIWMHFSWWFQIWSWNSTILIFFTNFVKCFTCRLHWPAAWKALNHASLHSYAHDPIIILTKPSYNPASPIS